MSAAIEPVARNSAIPMVSLPIIDDPIRSEVAAERERLLREAGLSVMPIAHFKRPVENRFTKSQRGSTTILAGGLTVRHEQLIVAALESLGYKLNMLPIPSKADFQAGKEFGNNGQCSPTYFTTGTLVNYLRNLRDKEGIPTEKIISDYVFLTAGACGPCRFGMYEAEYRLALRNAGFDGFRVLLFQQRAGLNQAEMEAGVELNINFFFSLLNSLFIGDILNEVAYQIRPYEVEPGSTDRAMAKCLEICQESLRSKNFDQIHGGKVSAFLSKFVPGVTGSDDVAKFLDQLTGDHFLSALRDCRELLDREVEVDYTRAKPTVKITGEFWAQTTEGDGNYRMFSFLEGEGAQVLVEPIATWINYMLHQAVQKVEDERGLDKDELPPKWWNALGKMRVWKKYRTKLFKFYLADKIVVREYNRMREALGGTVHELANQLELQRLGHPYYHSRTRGGEGHLEVAKNIYYANHHLAHMVLSLKPFGCMPSTQSDGAQAAVVSHFPEMIYLPVETSGEGDINAYSRVQMALGEAKSKSKKEFQECVARTGYSLEQIQEYIADHAELRRPIQSVEHSKGVVGQGANFVLHVGKLMNRAGIEKNSVSDTELCSVGEACLS